MADFRGLVHDITQARSKAAMFHKADLHVHSYESPDFPKVGDRPGCALELTEADHNACAQDIIDAAKQIEHLRLMAITDHHLSRAAAEISGLSDRDLVVLPGMEVSLQATIFPDSCVHVLSIFPEGCSSEDIQQAFLPSCGLPRYESRTENSVVTTPIDEFIEQVHKLGGICIAGHVNSDQGVRSLFRDSNVKLLRAVVRRKELQRRRKERLPSVKEEEQLDQLTTQIKDLEDECQNRYLEFLSTHQFDAVEVQRSSDSQFYTGVHTDELGIRPIPSLLGSDAHNLQDIGLAGSTTYVKMTTPGFHDLRRALLDPGARFRYEDTIQRPHIARILGIQFRGGFFQAHTLGFSDNLTCLIGGRGTGKSAAIEAIRYLFEHNLGHLPKEKRNDIQSRIEHTLNSATIEILISDRDGNEIVMQRVYGATHTTCYAPDGTKLEEIDVSAASNLDVKIYGWSEIEELARSKREQLRLIDGFVPEANDLVLEVRRDIQRLEANTGQMITLSKEIEQLLPRIAELPAKEAALKRLSTDELDAVFTEFDRNEAATSAIEVFRSEIDTLKTSFVDENGDPYEMSEDIERALEALCSTSEAYEWNDEFVAAIRHQTECLQSQYTALLAQFDNLVKPINERESILGDERTSIEAELSEKAAEVEGDEDFQDLVFQRRRLTDEISDLRAIQKQIHEKQASIDELMERRFQTIVQELQSKRRQLTRMRRAKIEEINQRLLQLGAAATVSIDLRHQKERESFRLALGAPDPGAPDGILKGVYRWYKRYNYAGLYSQRHSPHTFVQAVLNPGDFSALCVQEFEDGKVTNEVITVERAEQVAHYLSPYIDSGEPYYDPQKLGQLLALEHLDTEDLPIICLDGRPIEDLSPGQRCSAVIPIILLESDCPLIIDQPEDNLDNKLVFDLVVDILRGLKEQRQIIVATHNPNIPVSGDAEQIVVFEAPSRERCEIVRQGSIDDEIIVDQVKAIMEGSEEAFRIRAEKYGYRLDFVG